MGFKDVRARVIDALESGRVQHERRNLLYTNEVTRAFVVRLLRRCSGDQYEASKHYDNPQLVCHVFTPEVRGERWYVKVYFLVNDAVFISVHRS
ncbi:MAG: hypothetical protein KY467_18465 [Gemmatimonadetes bacterium]|nr:hypothetical protein [Gemmatimonadota bacterium]